MRRRAAIVALIASAVILAGCVGQPDGSPEPSRDPVGALVTCGGPAFPPSALTDGHDPMTMSAEPYGVLGRFLLDDGPDVAWLPDVGWHLLVATPDHVTVGRIAEQGAEEPPVLAIEITSEGGAWRVTGWGQCRPKTVLPDGLVAGEWWLAEAARPDVLVLKALVGERNCASGQRPDGRIAPPFIDYGRMTVTIAIGIMPRPGLQTCPGNPPIPFDIVLAEPLGDRSLLDGGSWPPLDPTRPRD